MADAIVIPLTVTLLPSSRWGCGSVHDVSHGGVANAIVGFLLLSDFSSATAFVDNLIRSFGGVTLPSLCWPYSCRRLLVGIISLTVSNRNLYNPVSNSSYQQLYQ